MDRRDSPPNRGQQPPRYEIPPWEIRQVSQVPFQEPAAGSGPQGQQQSRPARWPTRGGSKSSIPGPSLNTTVDSSNNNGAYGAPLSPESDGDPWNRQALPYETKTGLAPKQRFDAVPSTFAPQAPQAPPSPPTSVFQPGYRSTSMPPQDRPETKALPGTMSSRASRDGSRSRSRTQSRTRQPRRQLSTDQDASAPSFGHKFKSAMRDLFHKSPIDESKFERIQGKHWTEDY